MNVIIRILEAILYAINRSRKKDYADSPADAIANGERVQQSESSFADLADKPKRDRA